jgi:hypothetical protein
VFEPPPSPRPRSSLWTVSWSSWTLGWALLERRGTAATTIARRNLGFDPDPPCAAIGLNRCPSLVSKSCDALTLVLR